MDDVQLQQQGRPIRSGFFDRNAFREKNRLILVLQTAIAGLRYYVDQNSDEGRKLMEEITPGTELNLFRDPDNEHDKWAILVCTTDNKELGYVTRFKNETIARLMDYGKVFHAYVDEPPQLSKDEAEAQQIKTPTEDFNLPFSVYMED
ncbi:MAG: HIRAN domain-containing protein [Acutalibacteraceae bacterium]